MVVIWQVDMYKYIYVYIIAILYNYVYIYILAHGQFFDSLYVVHDLYIYSIYI